jgi:hypothetical protein
MVQGTIQCHYPESCEKNNNKNNVPGHHSHQPDQSGGGDEITTAML